MTSRTRHVIAAVARRTVAAGLPALWGCLALGMAGASPPAQGALSPSTYRASAVCPEPPPGSASCLALQLVAKAPLSIPGARALPATSRTTSRSASPTSEQATPYEQTMPEAGSLGPSALLAGYDLPTSTAPASTQTIALVDAYDDPTVEADLQHYDQQFDLPECTVADGCFRKVNQAATSSPLPSSTAEAAPRWSQEIATDVEMAHGVCRSCHILLVEAESEHFDNLEAAEQAAVALGATEISNSWGGAEPEFDSPAFNHPGIVITASAGDDGYRNWISEHLGPFTSYPAASPHVVAVGGTRLLLNEPTDSVRIGEEVWNDGAEEDGFKELASDGAGGGGCSELSTAPAWQRSLPNWAAVGCGEKRAVADVSADADPFTGVAVYDSTEVEGRKGWSTIGGTSVASPIIAAVFALAGGAHGVAYPAQTLYENAAKSSSSLHDITSGSNGECLEPLDPEDDQSSCPAEEEAAKSCNGKAICLAGPGYDGPTGLGTPNGLAAFEPTEAPPESHPEESTSAQSSPQPASQPPPIATPLVKPGIRLSHLALTLAALIALNRSHPRMSQVGFAFEISTSARIRVTLARLVRAHRHTRWQALPGALTFLANAGRDSRKLSGRRDLSAGDYRLTLTPVGASAQSLDFQIG
jgi:Subtilase family